MSLRLAWSTRAGSRTGSKATEKPCLEQSMNKQTNKNSKLYTLITYEEWDLTHSFGSHTHMHTYAFISMHIHLHTKKYANMPGNKTKSNYKAISRE